MRSTSNSVANNHYSQQVAQAAHYHTPTWKKWVSSLCFHLFGKSVYVNHVSRFSAGKLGLSEVELARISRKLKR